MLTRKHVRRAVRRAAAWPVGAPAIRRALRDRLERTARWSDDPGERAAAEVALGVFASYGWTDAAFAELGVLARQQAPRVRVPRDVPSSVPPLAVTQDA